MECNCVFAAQSTTVEKTDVISASQNVMSTLQNVVTTTTKMAVSSSIEHVIPKQNNVTVCNKFYKDNIAYA